MRGTPDMASEPRGLLGRMIAEVTPGNLDKVFFTLGGAEANENAIKFARLFTGKHKIITRYRSYHGATYGAITLSGDYRRPPVEPGIPGVIHVFDPYCYRCVFGYTRETCHRECITHIEEIIKFEKIQTRWRRSSWKGSPALTGSSCHPTTIGRACARSPRNMASFSFPMKS